MRPLFHRDSPAAIRFVLEQRAVVVVAGAKGLKLKGKKAEQSSSPAGIEQKRSPYHACIDMLTVSQFSSKCVNAALAEPLSQQLHRFAKVRREFISPRRKEGREFISPRRITTTERRAKTAMSSTAQKIPHQGNQCLHAVHPSSSLPHAVQLGLPFLAHDMSRLATS